MTKVISECFTKKAFEKDFHIVSLIDVNFGNMVKHTFHQISNEVTEIDLDIKIIYILPKHHITKILICLKLITYF